MTILLMRDDIIPGKTRLTIGHSFLIQHTVAKQHPTIFMQE